ncbi:voltage-gated potassium channel [Catalinimonas alkaloidigena]|uniref:ion transporter n=1 Tax=Catalinimonas alkaloidigena TaxID=1075417 RepID=UPI0024073D95|nr:ion transporter [Catalinimonas alkaloidigena]MDF9796998.1 voltage-gated potassium channel [Catalinimonas alkaloidigena]
MKKKLPSGLSTKERLYHIIFESDTQPGKAFDVALLIAILLSVLTVMLESVNSFASQYGSTIRTVEWIFTVMFTVEYILRIYCARRRTGYVLSFYGIVDLISVIPTYLSLVVVGTQYVLMIRILRLLRVFRVLKLYHFLGEAEVLGRALRQSAAKITVFIGTVITLIFIVGSLMYLIEGPENGFTSIPVSIYWAIVTLTTVGYGDIAPQTIAGQTLASVVMILGYGIIAVPTGIVSVEISKADTKKRSEKSKVKLVKADRKACTPQSLTWKKIEAR